ncbi:MAG: DUF1152 domain-containing protein [Thermoleophilaceae bacterium]
MLRSARRPLVIGIGGGGDVVGALATAEASRLYDDARPVLGGISWERQPVDPLPGPRTTAEIEGGEELAPGVLLTRADTRVRASGVRFAESHMAEFLGEETVLVDPTIGPRRIAASLAQAADRLDCDLIVFLDVGGDVLAHGDEPGLGSPLCDAILLASAARLQATGANVLGAIFGAGCDGELTLAELAARLAQLGKAGGLAGVRGITPPVAARLEAAMAAVITEASAQAVLAYRGANGTTTIRGGRRVLKLTPAAACTIYFDPLVAFEVTAPLARAVADANDLEQANRALTELGVRTELDGELRAAPGGYAP